DHDLEEGPQDLRAALRVGHPPAHQRVGEEGGGERVDQVRQISTGGPADPKAGVGAGHAGSGSVHGYSSCHRATAVHSKTAPMAAQVAGRRRRSLAAATAATTRTVPSSAGTTRYGVGTPAPGVTSAKEYQRPPNRATVDATIAPTATTRRDPGRAPSPRQAARIPATDRSA